MGNLNNERNQHLSDISKGITNIANSKYEKRTFIISIVSMIISIIAIAIAIIVPFIEYHLDKVNKPLLFDKDVNIDPKKGLSDAVISFNLQQGGIKKAYLAVKEKSGMVYENINGDFDNKSIRLSRESKLDESDISGKEIIADLNNAVNKELNMELSDVGEGYIKTIKIKDFSLILLDTTGQWWVYYFVTSPELIPIEGAVYNFEVKTDDGEIVASEQLPLDKQDMDYVMIDGTLTSELSIEKSLQDLETDYKLFSERRKIEGKNGEIFKSQPIMKDVCEPPKAEDVYKDIITIREDINTLSLN